MYRDRILRSNYVALAAAANGDTQAPPIRDFIGDDLSLFGHIKDPATHVVRVQTPIDRSLQDYIDYLTRSVRTFEVRPNILDMMIGERAKEKKIPITLKDESVIEVRVSPDMLIGNYDVLLRDAQVTSGQILDNIGSPTIITSLSLIYLTEEEVRKKIGRAKAYNRFGPHYDNFAPITKEAQAMDGKPISFTFLKTYVGEATWHARAEKLREALITVLNLDETRGRDRLIANGLRQCGYELLMRIAVGYSVFKRDPFLKLRGDHFGEQAQVGETMLFNESTYVTRQTSDFVAGLHSSPEAEEGPRAFLMGRGFYSLPGKKAHKLRN